MRQIGKLRPSAKLVQERFGDKELLVAEIGVQKGDNALSLVKLYLKQLYLIDIWKSYRIEGKYGETASDANFVIYLPTIIRRFGDNPRISILKTSSLRASRIFKDKYFDYVYLDACHSYDAVKEDISIWLPKVKSGGVLAGHDYAADIYSGLTRAVDDFIRESGFKFYQEDRDWWIIKQ